MEINRPGLKKALRALLYQLTKPWLWAAVICFLISAVLMYMAHRPPSLSRFQIGELSGVNLRSETTFFYTDRFEVEENSLRLENEVPSYFTFVPLHRDFFLANLGRLFSLGTNPRGLKARLTRDFHFTDDTAEYISRNYDYFQTYSNRIIYLYDNLVENYLLCDARPANTKVPALVMTPSGEKSVDPARFLVLPLEFETVKRAADQSFPGLSDDLAGAIAETLSILVRPTAASNPGARAERIRRQLSMLKTRHVIERGENLIRRGELVTKDKLARLLAYADYKTTFLNTRFPAYVLLALVIYALIIYRFLRFEREIFRRPYHYAVALLTYLFVHVSFLLFPAVIEEFGYIPGFIGIPYAVLTMAVPLLLGNLRSSVILLVTLPFFLLFYPWFDILTFVNLLVLALITIYTAQILRNRNDFFMVAIIIGLVQGAFALVSLAFGSQKLLWGDILILLTGALANGLFSAIVSSGVMPLLENAFKIPTRFKLLELTNPTTSPLLKELKTEAPGTYNHSLLIGDMCETPAAQLGIDPLLVKAGGYYHDIGKSENPQYFVENQEKENRHDEIKPSVSVSVIKSHIKLGIELARRHRLPEEVVDFIREHHGTNPISYFYHQALGLFGDEYVNIEDYEYPGPKPHTKGSALLMLADGIEAAVRAYSQNNERISPKIIQDIIEDIVDNRMRSGQLDECEMTLHDLKIISEEFYKFLAAYYHKRIEYSRK